MSLAVDVSSCFDNGRLKLILLPTEQCNFRCTYCYEDFLLRRMPSAVVSGVKNLLAARAPTLHTLHLSWFGGEPLVARSIVQDISAFATALKAATPGLSYTADMTTNGYLLDGELAKSLTSTGVTTYQISLDGPAEVHDRSRKRLNGGGSFSTIWGNLAQLHESELNFSVVLRVHFTPVTYRALKPLIDDINAVFGGDHRFRVLFRAVGRLGGDNDEAIETFATPAEQRDAEEMLSGWLLRPQEDVAAPGGTSICYASQPNSLIVRANGDLAKCTVALRDPRNRVGRLRPDGSLEIDQPAFRGWLEGIVTLDEKTLECPYRVMMARDADGRVPVELTA